MLIEKASTARPRLPQLRQLPTPDAPRRQRHPHPTRQDHAPVTTLRSEEPVKYLLGGIIDYEELSDSEPNDSTDKILDLGDGPSARRWRPTAAAGMQPPAGPGLPILLLQLAHSTD